MAVCLNTLLYLFYHFRRNTTAILITMSNSRRKISSEKVVKAMTLNQNEDRILAKTFGTLALEKEFSKKVLNLQMRTVKNNFRNLKEKVAKIKSNLTPDEIMALRELDAEGKLPQLTTFNLNAAMKIAAAARRLKLDLDRPKTARSAGVQRLYRENTAPPKLLHNRPKTTNSMKRSNSVTGVFIDAPEPDTNVRRSSIDGGITLRPLSANIDVHADEKMQSSNDKQPAGRPATSAGLTVKREKSSVSFRTTSGSGQYTPYSSHSVADKDHSLNALAERRSSFITTVDDAIENNLGGDLFEDRRQELITEEQLFYNTLQRKKKRFLDSVDAYLKDNPPAEFDIEPLLAVEGIARDESSADEESDEPLHASHLPANVRRQLKRQFEIERTFTTEEEYRQKGNDLWKDMNKTRYLRLPDDRLDLSGVVTLAKDQMKLYELLRSSEPAHIVNVK